MACPRLWLVSVATVVVFAWGAAEAIVCVKLTFHSIPTDSLDIVPHHDVECDDANGCCSFHGRLATDYDVDDYFYYLPKYRDYERGGCCSELEQLVGAYEKNGCVQVKEWKEVDRSLWANGKLCHCDTDDRCNWSI